MRVLVAHNRYRSAAPSGENRVVDTETAALRARGHEVLPYERGSDEIADWPAARRAALPALVVRNPAVRRDLRAVLERTRPDVVHVHNTFPLLSASVLHACRDAGVPVVVTLHNYKLLCASGDFFAGGAVCHRCATGNPLPGLARGCYRGSRPATASVAAAQLVNRRAWRSLVQVHVAVSAAEAALLAGLGLDPARVVVKHNLVPEPALPGGSGALDGPRRPVVCYVGRLDDAKGVPVLMAAWDAYLARGDAGLTLVVAGGGPLEPQVRRWAAARPSVRLAGMLTPAGCTELLAGSRAVVLPSAWEETFGLVAVEAMACGTPALVAGHGALAELVTDGVDGAHVPPGDAQALAGALADVATRPQEWAERGRAARATYRSSHDPEANVDQLLEVYARAVRELPRRDAARGAPGRPAAGSRR